MYRAAFLLLLATCSCAQRAIPPITWLKIDAPQARVRMLLPCRPDNGYSSRLAGAVYEVSCETNQFRATASVKKHLSEFNTQTAKDEFNNNEMILKTMFGEIKDFKEQEVSDNEREYVLTLKTGAEIRERIFINEYGVYDGFIGTKGPSNISDFNSVADKFLSSIEPN